MASLDNMDPALPQDLERKIFELAAHRDIRSIPTLMRVAWRFKAWLEPLLYRASFLDIQSCSYPGRHPGAFLDAFTARPEFFRDAMRHVGIGGRPLGIKDFWWHDNPPPIAELVLGTCTRLETLLLLGPTEGLRPLIEQLESLTRMHADFRELFGGLPLGQRRTGFTALNFSRITHLEMLDRKPSKDICSGLAHLPCLTHLALVYNGKLPGMASLCRRVLRSCTQLRVFAALIETPMGWKVPDSSSPRYVEEKTSPAMAIDDLRFVVVKFPKKWFRRNDWLEVVRSVPGYWQCAEGAVKRRIARWSSKKQQSAPEKQG
ncbi:hypothetical protein C8R47DRAFT_1220174 [Mycena vitilis]|nr:hypothetical protein C8R47DRAFT_1220174 [Mycena vitilis]